MPELTLARSCAIGFAGKSRRDRGNRGAKRETCFQVERNPLRPILAVAAGFSC